MTKSQKKTELIEFITTNCDCWKVEGSKEILNSFDLDRLKLIKSKVDQSIAVANSLIEIRQELKLGDEVPVGNECKMMKERIDNLFQKKKDAIVEEDDEEEEIETTTKSKGKKVMNSTPKTVEEWLEQSNAPEEVVATITNAKVILESEKAKVIETLTQNMKEQKEKDEAKKIYSTLSINQLNALLPTVLKSGVDTSSLFNRPKLVTFLPSGSTEQQVTNKEGHDKASVLPLPKMQYANPLSKKS